MVSMPSWWITEPNCGRGPFGILSDCLLTIFFAVWTVQHPDTGETSKGDRAFDTLLSLALPEYTTARAVHQLFSAFSIRRRMRDASLRDWTLKQSFAIVMAIHLGYPIEDSPTISRFAGWTGFLPNRFFRQRRPGERGDVVLNEFMRLEQILPKTIAALPNNETLDHQSKTNSLAKILALIQALAFVFRNMVSRLATNIPISPFESVTFAYLVCAFITWLSFLQKPHEIEDPIVINLSQQDADQVRPFVKTPVNYRRTHTRLWTFCSIFVTAGALVGITLRLTWFTPFASTLERQLWLGTNFATLGSIPLFILISFCPNDFLKTSVMILLGLNRLAVLGQSIAAFRTSPTEIYVKAKPDWVWTNYWPSFGV